MSDELEGLDSSMGEWETRRRLIDRMLLECGWKDIVGYQPGVSYHTVAVREYPTENGPADYALFTESVLVGFVEAKRVGKNPLAVVDQAERYARGIQDNTFSFGEYGVPFVYATNGVVYAFRDLRDPQNLRREIARFHTPGALEELLSRDIDVSLEKLQTMPYHPILRPYQREAIAAVEDRLREKRRRMLLAMATGTGKTYNVVSLIYRLMASGYAKRVLFLVDRRALAAQAVTTLHAFEAEPNKKFGEVYEVYSSRFRRSDLDEDEKFDPKVLPEKYLTMPQPGHSFVYVCTIQRMRMNLFGDEYGFSSSGDGEEEEDAYKMDIPIHAFDLIIADECHRGYTSQESSKWREVLDHFDAITIGLTATPAAHTTSFFKELAYRYSYEEAVKDGFLVDYDAVRIHSDITMDGMDLKEGQAVTVVDTHTGQKWYDVLEDERHFDTTQIERDATAPDRNRKIIREFKEYLLAQEREMGRCPKTLIFAVNDIPHTSHADQLVNIINEEFNRGQNFCKKITGNTDRPLEMIRKYRNRPEPSIVVTVDMLSTGVDVPKIENILLIRPVKSRILFEQMLGRGTRLCKELSPPKDHFTVFDVYNVIEAFKDTVDIVAEAPDKPTRSISEVVQAIHDNQDRDYNTRILTKRLLRISKNISSSGRERFAEFTGTEDVADFARGLWDKLENDWGATIGLLRKEDFIRLLEDYPREKIFIIGDEIQDQVTSEYLFRTTDGRALKPNDYITAFGVFIREHPSDVEALEVLLERPEDFHTDELYELRKTLEEQPERFTEKRLRQAYNKELADIISLVKHVAKNVDIEDPQDRAHRAMILFRQEKAFTPEQEKWLGLIEQTLIKRIILEKTDFDLPPFSRLGGYMRANDIFEGELESIIVEINKAVLA